ncbi:MAG: hypothetical protein WAO76_17375 [Georgfuchsia sp.]
MKYVKMLIVFLLLGVSVMGAAWADRGHHHYGGRGHIGVMIGIPWSPWYYPPPYYYSPYNPPVVVQSQPQVYIEQQPAASTESYTAGDGNYWYHCASAKAYYPYVKECPEGWQKVLPQPPQQP